MMTEQRTWEVRGSWIEATSNTGDRWDVTRLMEHLNSLEVKLAASEATVARRAAALSNRAGYCWHCSNFTGEDKVQGGRGDEAHEDWCQIGQALTSARSQAGETHDQVQTHRPSQVSGTSAQAGRTPRVRL